ncbi:MAG: hypothetical protein GYA43_03385 [Bacteroidales bacterium]|nr:hypothetical protein [Bacteroidales bacterium]
MRSYVYLLYSAKPDTYYKGQTGNPAGRLIHLYQWYEKSMSRRAPWILAWYMFACNRAEALLSPGFYFLIGPQSIRVLFSIYSQVLT